MSGNFRKIFTKVLKESLCEENILNIQSPKKTVYKPYFKAL